jgi:hypothetical protein
VYESVIQRTMEQMSKAPESTGVRKEVLDAIKRRWIGSLDKLAPRSESTGESKTSNPDSVVNRSKYMTYPTQDSVKLDSAAATEASSPPAPPKPADEDDDYADEFGDAEVVHTSEVGRRLAVSQPAVTSPEAPRRPLPTRKPAEPIDPIPLTDDLADPEYDSILEPIDCEYRVFGQTEVCESVVGPRRWDSRWMVTILNGFVRLPSGDEMFFRTAKSTLPHLHQHKYNQK